MAIEISMLRSSISLYNAKVTQFKVRFPCGRKSEQMSCRSRNNSELQSLLSSKPIFTSTVSIGKKRADAFICKAALPHNEGSKPNEESLAPLQPESPVGQFLVQILKSHPHLFPAAAEQQIERMVAEKEEEIQKGEATNAAKDGTDLVLYKRISEVREAERKRALEEVIYSLIVQRFKETDVGLVSQIPFISITNLNPTALVATLGGPPKDKELLAVHSEEAREMVKEHLSVILGGRTVDESSYMDDRILIQTSKIRMGQIYAASIMYGYFLRRVDQRYQLEKTMKMLAADGNIWDAFDTDVSQGSDESKGKNSYTGAEASTSGGDNEKPVALRQYVMSFDAETIKQTASLRSNEGLRVIEKQTEALFGKAELVVNPDGGLAIAKDEQVGVTLTTLKRVVLEAVAFGSFLWDVESYVDSRYKITNP